ncbi:23S rRNA (adenine(2503)-C(2))-methyltransferase RlmN [Candidatus Peregrinibacteria bacterium]|nr:23S rRNA (adenine(2503)-C(2))-methyltransferase RlmN [Candidatus Peregrinibacteria bacterium]
MFSDILTSWGEKKYRILQVNHGIFRELVSDFSEISTLPEPLRKRFHQEKIEFSLLKPKKIVASSDGNTEKVLFRTHEGKYIESVLMHHKRRKTVCVSSQIGCPAGCVFCATGKLGITRNLETREIIEQVLFWSRHLKNEWQKTNPQEKWKPLNPPHEARVRNIVFMGMGEPLFNYENVVGAIKTLNDPKKFGIGVRHITVSTVGIIPGIEKLMHEKLGVHLAFSLHAPTEELRSSLVPMNKTFSLTKLMKVLDEFTKMTGRRIFYEYVVLQGKNDGDEDAKVLGKLLERRLAHVNFIPYNVNPECGDDLKKPEEKRIRDMQKILEKYNVPSTIRLTMGDEIAGACGQLASKEE